MKIVIDIPKMAYEAYKEWHKNKVATVEQSLIANGTPYEERPKGKWVLDKEHSITMDFYKCTNCNYFGGATHYNFCPNCGAEMRYKEAEE